VEVEAIEPKTGALRGHQEVWIMCGLKGSENNMEHATADTQILNPANNVTFTAGPKLPYECGGCAAASLDYTNRIGIKVELVCAVLGSQGTHDDGVFLNTTTCYDRVLRTWITFSAPFQLDHHAADRLHATMCPGGRQLPQRLVVHGGRPASYGDNNANVYVLELTPEVEALLQHGSRDHQAVIHTMPWQRLVTIPDEQARSAGAEVSYKDRYLFTFGGIAHYPTAKGKHTGVSFNNVMVVDTCTAQFCIPWIGTLIDRVGPSASVVYDHLAVICGGMGSQTMDERYFYPEFASEQMPTTASERELFDRSKNDGSCEVVDLSLMLVTCEGRWLESLPTFHYT
jgi:hypothetical protein